jgi:hypothetical protein
MRGEFSSPFFGNFSFEVPHLTTTEPLTPLSPPSIRTVALRALFYSRFVEGDQDRFHRLRVKRRRLSRSEVPSIIR